MDGRLPASGSARRIALVVWTAIGALGTIAVWRLSSYLDSLTALARTDRQAALTQFRWRVLPVFIILVVVAVVAGGVLVRQGLKIVRLGGLPVENRFPPATTDDQPRRSPVVGWTLAVAGLLMAGVPVLMLSVLFWLLQR